MIITLRVSEAEILYSLVTGTPQGESATARRGVRALVKLLRESHLSLHNKDLFLLLESKLREAIDHARAHCAEWVSAEVFSDTRDQGGY